MITTWLNKQKTNERKHTEMRSEQLWTEPCLFDTSYHLLSRPRSLCRCRDHVHWASVWLCTAFGSPLPVSLSPVTNAPSAPLSGESPSLAARLAARPAGRRLCHCSVSWSTWRRIWKLDRVNELKSPPRTPSQLPGLGRLTFSEAVASLVPLASKASAAKGLS